MNIKFEQFEQLPKEKKKEFYRRVSESLKKNENMQYYINGKNYCIFINKKSGIMILAKFTFVASLFDGTLFDGELIKNDRDEWIFMINDIIYYESQSLITQSLSNRIDICKSI